MVETVVALAILRMQKFAAVILKRVPSYLEGILHLLHEDYFWLVQSEIAVVGFELFFVCSNSPKTLQG